MERTGRAGIATFVMRDKEYLVAILADHGVLTAETMRFADELRSPEAVGLPKMKKPPRALVGRLEQAIEALAAKRIAFEELEDDEAERVLALVERKRKRGEDVIEAPEAAEEEGEQAEIIDLMEVLKRSLGETSGKRPARRATPARKRAAKSKRGRAARSLP